MTIISRAPANTILMGEHSVVAGHPAIACALDQHLALRWTPRTDHTLCIHSSLGHAQWSLNHIEPQAPLHFIGEALKAFQPYLTHGWKIEVTQSFDATIGFGSSAAVLAATLTGLNTLCETQFDRLTLFQMGLKIIQTLQGRGSGTDLAASLYGGVIIFQPATQTTPPQITPLPQHHPLHNHPLTLVYAGYKTPTSEVLQHVAQQWQTLPEQLSALYQLMGQATHATAQADEPQTVYHLFNHYHGLLDALGVNDLTLSQLTYQLRQASQIHASKISGSGLGDCVLGLGTLSPASQKTLLPNHDLFTPQICSQGAIAYEIH